MGHKYPPCSSQQLVKGLCKLGLLWNPKVGDGSHGKLTDPKTGRSTTVPKSKSLSMVRVGIIEWVIALGYSEQEVVRSVYGKKFSQK